MRSGGGDFGPIGRRPVKLQWTREEEFTCGYSRPAGLLEVESAVDAQGRLTAMRFANYNSGAAGIRPQYEIPHHWVGFYKTRSFVRQGSYRSLAAWRTTSRANATWTNGPRN